MSVIRLIPMIVISVILALSAGETVADDLGLKEGRKFSRLYFGAGLSADYISAPIHGKSESDISVAYNAFVGWRYQLKNDWVLGLEGALGDRKGNLKSDGVRLKFGYNWHWSTVAGKVIGDRSDQFLYVKLGVGGVQVKGTAHGERLGSHNFKGTRYALGFERPLWKSVDIRVETSYISYDSDFEQIQATFSLLYAL